MHGCVGFVEVWAWDSILLGNVSAVFLKCLLKLILLVCDVLNIFSPGPVIL